MVISALFRVLAVKGGFLLAAFFVVAPASAFLREVQLGAIIDGPEADQIRRVLRIGPDDLPSEHIVGAPIPIIRPRSGAVTIYKAYTRCVGQLCPTFLFEGASLQAMFYAGRKVILFQNQNAALLERDYLGLEGKCVDFAIHFLNPGFWIDPQPKAGLATQDC